MDEGKIDNLLIPNVSKLMKKINFDTSEKNIDSPNEFSKILDGHILNSKIRGEKIPREDIGIKLSHHAKKRLLERNLEMDGDEYFKIKNGMQKLRNKGGQDSLIVTKNAAYIVDIKNNTIVTAVNNESVGDNIFTKIDSTIIIH